MQIRSFVRRAGRMTPRQQKAMEEAWPDFAVDFKQQQVDFSKLFGRTAPVILEIGFGMGASLREMALARPEDNFLGIEVHPPGVGALLADISDQDITNIRIIQHDAVEVLTHMIAPESLAGVMLLFPDPWHKKRHHKRRLVQSNFVELVLEKLQPDGFFHLATDWAPYAEQMMEVVSANPAFKNIAGKNQFIPDQTLRPKTKFEARGKRLGHEIFDLYFVKQL